MANHERETTTTSTRGSEESDRAWFAAQYRDLHPRLTLVAAGIIRDRTHAEDIVQEAALIGLRKLNEFSRGTNFSAWLTEIVRRCAWNYSRKQRNRATHATDPAALDQSAASDSPSGWIGSTRRADATGATVFPGNTLDLSDYQTDFDDELMHALQSVSEDARCCLLLRVVGQLTYTEISELLQMPEGTAMSHVHRSKVMLRRFLTQRGSPSSGRDSSGKTS
ncbi:MAG: RNA polymerase sigma factor [Planctomycetales bacterium]|nr:RNA polymerase sigma factor [Planctomycetales bacterium]